MSLTPCYWSTMNWREKLTHWKRPWCWERLKAGEGDGKGWDDWMASLTLWTWVWASSRRWWRTGKLGVLRSMGSQRVRHNWVTELNWWTPTFVRISPLRWSPPSTTWPTCLPASYTYLSLGFYFHWDDVALEGLGHFFFTDWLRRSVRVPRVSWKCKNSGVAMPSSRMCRSHLKMSDVKPRTLWKPPFSYRRTRTWPY